MEANWIIWDSDSGLWLGLCCFLSKNKGENPHPSINILTSQYHSQCFLDIWILIINHGLNFYILSAWVHFICLGTMETNRMWLSIYSVHRETLC